MTTTSTDQQLADKIYQRYAWLILFVLCIFLILNMLFLFVAPVEEIFEMDTGVAWSEFSTDYPDVASEYLLEQRLLYTAFLGIALFGLVIAFGGFRKGQRWAWYTMWVFPATLILTVIVLALHGQPEIGAFYVVFVVIALLGLLLPFRKFFPNAPV